MTIHSPTHKQRMLAGSLYDGNDAELTADRAWTATQLTRLNTNANTSKQAALLRMLLGSIGADSIIRPPFFCDYGSNIHLGSNVFLNFNCIILDVVTVHIGDRTQIGPAVQLYTADHPRDPETRRSGLESGRPITIGKNVWISGGAIILPGITIGDDAIIGAGSVVTRNVPAGTTVAGNPARPLRSRA